MRPITIILFCVLTIQLHAQNQYPYPLPVYIDSLLWTAAKTKTPSDAANASQAMQRIDSALQHYRNKYSLYTGIIRLYQGIYQPAGDKRNYYLDDAFQLIADNYTHLADSFSSQCSQLLNRYYRAKRLNEWQPFDSLLRLSASINTSYTKEDAIANHAYNAYLRNDFYTAAYLSEYNNHYRDYYHITETETSSQYGYDLWMILKLQYDNWRNTPYYKRNENTSFKQDFEDVNWQLKYITLVSDTRDVFLTFNYAEREKYYRIYSDMLLHMADWCIQDHREGRAIMPLKQFIFYTLIPFELQRADKDPQYQPVISEERFVALVTALSQLYRNIGNGTDAYDILDKAISFINNYKPYHGNNTTSLLNDLFIQQATAAGMAGKYEAAYTAFDILKKRFPAPLTVDTANLEPWLKYMDVRMAEIETLIGQDKDSVARAFTRILIDSIAPLDEDSIQSLYTLKQWPHIEYLGSHSFAARSKWKDASQWLLTALKTIEDTDNNWEDEPYYYPTQLLYLIARYRNENFLMKNVVANLLFYTGRHLEHSFTQITPTERMQLYDRRLKKYFDVYHELLFTHTLDSFPSLTKSLIAQSLYLKNALSDGLGLPDSLLGNKGDTARQSLIRDIRANRNLNQLLMNRLKMRNNEVNIERQDKQQLIWLTLLETAEVDTLERIHSWETIASKLHSNEVYIETVRYTNWLSDSSVRYGAYVMSNGTLQLIDLFSEDSLLLLLKDVTASPQNAALDASGTRGISIKNKPKKKTGFVPGSVDRLGVLVLHKLWPHIENKKTLYIVPDGMLNRISLAALQWNKKYLFEYIQLRQLTSNAVLNTSTDTLPAHGKVLLAGGLQYGNAPATDNINRLFSTDVTWNYLPGTLTEAKNLAPIFSNHGFSVTSMQGNALTDKTAIDTLPGYTIIHLATHGFYADSTLAAQTYSFKHWNREAILQEPLYRCGIALSQANNPDPNNASAEGYLMGYELAYTDLRQCYLICLSACETGLGDLRNNLGVDGLGRALKLGGAKYLLTSLWKVPDAATAEFMEQFYKALFTLRSPYQALEQTRKYMSRKYTAVDWGAFVLME